MEQSIILLLNLLSHFLAALKLYFKKEQEWDIVYSFVPSQISEKEKEQGE